MGAASLETNEAQGLINFLMRNRHGSPFEHGAMTFRIKTQIFTWREFMRHRIGFSYNEQSGRYMEMIPEFYRPGPDRPLVQEGKPGEYILVKGTYHQETAVNAIFSTLCKRAWDDYQILLKRGIAKEVARMILPVGTFSTAYVTCNPRSMMSFLSLRTKNETSTFPSYPQYEIAEVAGKMEAIFAELYPMTYKAFQESGRVSP